VVKIVWLSVNTKLGKWELQTWRTFLPTIVLASITVLVSPGVSKALGPWKAQVVDAETKKPLDDVVVIAVWSTYRTQTEGPGAFGYVDSEEVVTGNDGRFIIAAKDFTNSTILVFDEPEFYLFKPGYGQWRFQGEEQWLKLDPPERRKHYAEAGRQLADQGGMIELLPLKSQQERLQFYQSPRSGPYGYVPLEKMKRWRQADETERKYLGI
jgi:hypothetical protein